MRNTNDTQNSIGEKVFLNNLAEEVPHHPDSRCWQFFRKMASSLLCQGMNFHSYLLAAVTSCIASRTEEREIPFQIRLEQAQVEPRNQAMRLVASRG